MFINNYALSVILLSLGIMFFGWGFYDHRRDQLGINIFCNGKLVDSTFSLARLGIDGIAILGGYFTYMAAFFNTGILKTDSAILFSSLVCSFNILLILPVVVARRLANRRNELDGIAIRALM